MATILPEISPELRKHIEGLNFMNYSRVPSARLTETALPNIGQIELVTAQRFAELYDELYISMFPNSKERERTDLITSRLIEEFGGKRQHLAPYKIVGILDHDGKAIGASHFSVLLLPNHKYAIPYVQYIYVRKENRRQDMAEVLHALTLTIATADGAAHKGRTVPFELFETEPPGHGDNEEHRAIATQRAMIHTKAGAEALMLRRVEDDVLVSPHVQPGLEVGDLPVSLVWAIRPSPAWTNVDINVAELGADLIAAYYQSLRDEGFPEANIRIAEEIVAKRCANSVFLTMSLNDVDLSKDELPHSRVSMTKESS